LYQKKRYICWRNVGVLAAELWWVVIAFWLLVVAILRLKLILGLVAMLALWLIYPLLMGTVKDIRARRSNFFR